MTNRSAKGAAGPDLTKRQRRRRWPGCPDLGLVLPWGQTGGTQTEGDGAPSLQSLPHANTLDTTTRERTPSQDLNREREERERRGLRNLASLLLQETPDVERGLRQKKLRLGEVDPMGSSWVGRGQ